MVLTGLPGTFVAWAGVVITAIISGFEVIGVAQIVFLLGIAVLGEVLDFVSSLAGAKKFGGSRKGMGGAIMGGMVGAVFFTAIAPGPGTLLGVVAGTFTGAFLGEYIEGREILQAGRAGWGAFLGKITAMAIKILLILGIGTWSLYRFLYM